MTNHDDGDTQVTSPIRKLLAPSPIITYSTRASPLSTINNTEPLDKRVTGHRSEHSVDTCFSAKKLCKSENIQLFAAHTPMLPLFDARTSSTTSEGAGVTYPLSLNSELAQLESKKRSGLQSSEHDNDLMPQVPGLQESSSIILRCDLGAEQTAIESEPTTSREQIWMPQQSTSQVLAIRQWTFNATFRPATTQSIQQDRLSQLHGT